MNNALAHKTELEAITANYDQAIAEVRNDVIHSILHVALRITERGRSVHVNCAPGYLHINYFDENETCTIIQGLGETFMRTPEQLIDALRQLEELENSTFVDDTLMIFAKEGE